MNAAIAVGAAIPVVSVRVVSMSVSSPASIVAISSPNAVRSPNPAGVGCPWLEGMVGQEMVGMMYAPHGVGVASAGIVFNGGMVPVACGV